MAQFQHMFDARTVEPSAGIELVPAGDYKVRIIESEIKGASNNPNNGMLAFKLEIIEGPYTGKTLVYNLNLYHSSQQTCEIAYKQLSALCWVTGVLQVQSSEQLHGIPFMVNVSNDGTYNNVKRVMDLNGQQPGKGGSRPAAPAPATPAQPAAAPWNGAPQPASSPTAPMQPNWGPPQPAPAAAPSYGPPQPSFAQPAAAPAPAQNGWGPPVAQPQPAATPAAPAPAWNPGAPAAGAQPPWAQR